MAVTSVRDLLLAAAYQRLSKDGIGALQARSLARDVGVSTTVLYTNFGSMGGLLVAVCEECFASFGDAITAPGVTDDPLADVFAMGLAYRNHAIRFPNEYELMFTSSVHRVSRGVRMDHTETPSPMESDTGARAFAALVARARALVDAKVVNQIDPVVLAMQLWSALHGCVSLEMAGHFAGQSDLAIVGGLFVNFYVGTGAEPDQVVEALGKAISRVPLIPLAQPVGLDERDSAALRAY